MEPYALQQAITEDLNQLKDLKIGIIPAKIYYRGLFRLAAGAFWKIGLVFLLATAYVTLTYTNPHAAMSSMYWGAVRGATFYGGQIKEVLLITTGIMLVVTLVLTPSLNSYFLIQYHLKKQLQTGEYLVKKLQHAGWLFLGAFSILSTLFASGSEPGVIVICEVLSLILSAVVTFFVMSLEFNRLGLSVLYQVIGMWLNKDSLPTS
ncbi:hypothetical protein SAMN02746093_02899 [Legionella quinlivanii DSM 21216]|uniref:hypothetical protein n=1 Tax=Legionella quinlivanii TaxID=45073 RepID=UPI00089E6617|nr:hypothetical protein [Legionella quinlivanii]SEG42410.1 hypothetical protein SAMN02746093_02899 [Legionella quinlivanii DSM 21216]